MTAPILVTGGTGSLGRRVVPRLRQAGARVRVLSRRAHQSTGEIEYVTGDLDAGEGIEAAVAGVRTVVHLAGGAKGDDDKARHLVRAASRAGVGHIVNISVVGADRIPVTGALDRAMFGYFAAQHAADRILMESGVPWTILRATQFYDLLFTVARQAAKLPVIPAPAGFRFQPVDAAEVAERMVGLALAGPSGLAAEIGGPRVYGFADLIRAYLRATGRRRAFLPVRLPGAAARAFRDGANLAPGSAAGTLTWEEFLEHRAT